MRESFISQTLARLHNLHKQLVAGFDSNSLTPVGEWVEALWAKTVGTSDAIKRSAMVAGKAIETLETEAAQADMYADAVWQRWLDLAESTEKGMAAALGLSADYSVYASARTVTANAVNVSTQLATGIVSKADKILEPGNIDKLMYLVVAIVVLVLLVKLT